RSLAPSAPARLAGHRLILPRGDVETLWDVAKPPGRPAEGRSASGMMSWPSRGWRPSQAIWENSAGAPPQPLASHIKDERVSNTKRLEPRTSLRPKHQHRLQEEHRMRVFFTTTIENAEETLQNGFTDLHAFGSDTGCWFASEPLGINEGFPGDVVLCL